MTDQPRTFQGYPVQLIDDQEVIEVPDDGVSKCCEMCTFYRAKLKTVNKCAEQEIAKQLMCGVHGTFYVSATPKGWEKYTHGKVLARMDGRLNPSKE